MSLTDRTTLPGGPTATTAAGSRKAEATRQALLQAARVVIARDGYSNARIADIAREAGKAVGVFYSYFKDKTELFAALVDAFHQDLTRQTPAPSAYEENTAAAVKAAVTVFWSAYRQFHPEMLGLLESGLADPDLLQVWRKIRAQSIRRFAFRIKRQQAQGKCLALDPELAASALAGLLEFTCFNWHSGKLDFPDTQVGDEAAVETLYQMIAKVLELPIDNVSPPKAKAPARAKRAAPAGKRTRA